VGVSRHGCGWPFSPSAAARPGVDGRDKPGHDGDRAELAARHCARRRLRVEQARKKAEIIA